MIDQKARAHAVAKLMTDRVVQSLLAVKPRYSVRDFILDSVFPILGLVFVGLGTFWLYKTFQSFSLSLVDLVPTTDVAIENIDKIAMQLSHLGVDLTIIFGAICIGLSLFGFGYAWIADRSNTRNNVTILTFSSAMGQAITEVILEEVYQLSQHTEDNSRGSKRRIKK